jgi:hypothetical protein
MGTAVAAARYVTDRWERYAWLRLGAWKLIERENGGSVARRQVQYVRMQMF